MPHFTGPMLFATLFAVLAVGGSSAYALNERFGWWGVVEDVVPSPTYELEGTVPPIRDTDHVRGNPNAPILFYVYSDFACPYCKQFHATMSGIIRAYGLSGQVAWVFRHLPILKAHPASPTYALASECVAHIGGEQAFWNFADALYEHVTPDVTLGPQELTRLATDQGVPEATFGTCMRANDLMVRIERDYAEALALEASATPFTVLVAKGEHVALTEAVPYTVLAALIESILELPSITGKATSTTTLP